MSEVTRERQVSLSEWRCRKCGQPLMSVPSGSTCINGCVGILPKMPALVRRINHAILSGIQRVENRWGHYYLGDGTEVVLGKQISREVKGEEIKEVVLDGTRIYKVDKRIAADGAHR